MPNSGFWKAFSAALLLTLAASPCGQLFAQMSVTGAVSGTVVDASGAMVPAATVKLTSETTKQARETKSDNEGLFSFTAVPRDTYTLKLEHTGFKSIVRTGIAVSANEKVALSTLTLELGSAAETVTVAATQAGPNPGTGYRGWRHSPKWRSTRESRRARSPTS